MTECDVKETKRAENTNCQTTDPVKTESQNKITQNTQATNKTTVAKQVKKPSNNKSKKATSSSSAFVLNEIKPIKRTPAKMLEMQQAFVENYYNLPPNNANGANNRGVNGNPNGKANGENNQNTQAANTQINPEGNPNNLGTLGQIAPLFNLLGGGKNAQIGSLISALGDGKMDMNKVISAMAPAAGSGGGSNLFNVFNPGQSKKASTSPKEAQKSQDGGKSIKDLHKI